MKTIKIPQILLPKTADMTAWSVNACDQYTSDADYWKSVEKLTDGKFSTYNLIFPEIYLKERPEERISKINSKMLEYLDGGVFKTVENGFILVERTTQSGTRTGLVISIDLEDYSFEIGAKTPIRSTEATILERIPPRVAIRKSAAIELPHVMLLYNDPKNTVLNGVKKGEKLYDFEMNMNGGHIVGTFVENADEVCELFYDLVKADADKFLFAVGDGNHSLATAKTCWESIKNTLNESERLVHPARYALVEAVNLFDKALEFKPIHRLVKTERIEEFKKGLKLCGGQKAYLSIGGKLSEIDFDENTPNGIRALDKYIGEFLIEDEEVDYIHGDEELKEFTKVGGVGILLPSIPKDSFFNLIKTGGNLPRKTFSMGEGNEKRYYIEAKLIK